MQPKSTLHHSCKLRKEQPPQFENGMAHRMPETPLSFSLAISEYVLGFFVQPCPTSWHSTHKPEPAPDPAPEGILKHWYYLLHFGCYFLYFPRYLPSVPGGERLPRTTSCSALTQANYQSCWREITTKGPTRMSESISWREKFAGDSRKREVTGVLNKKICRYFNISLSLPTPSQFACNFSSCHPPIPRDKHQLSR